MTAEDHLALARVMREHARAAAQAGRWDSAKEYGRRARRHYAAATGTTTRESPAALDKGEK